MCNIVIIETFIHPILNGRMIDRRQTCTKDVIHTSFEFRLYVGKKTV